MVSIRKEFHAYFLGSHKRGIGGFRRFDIIDHFVDDVGFGDCHGAAPFFL